MSVPVQNAQDLVDTINKGEASIARVAGSVHNKADCALRVI